MNAPPIVDFNAEEEFLDACLAAGLDPELPHVGGYVDWEWERSRHLFDDLLFTVRGARVLEVGFHLGATAIVLASLGAAHVEGTERLEFPDFEVAAARANVCRYGFDQRRIYLHRGNSTAGPESFDVISCISVLEYIKWWRLRDFLPALGRLLKPGGHLVISGTSNRLFPMELHEGSWANYLPYAVDDLLGRELRRGVSPFAIRRFLPGYEDLLLEGGGERLLELRRRMGRNGLGFKAHRAINTVASPFGMHAGYFMPNITMVLRKPR